jgi:hypothetical protein
MIFFAYNNYSHKTRKYANTVFSDAEWQSPEKTRRLELLRPRERKLLVAPVVRPSRKVE